MRGFPDTTPEAALWYADHDFAVFPLQRNKLPVYLYGERGEDLILATTNPSAIRQWWQQVPDANIGIATGTHSGCFVLDVDGEEGEDSLHRLQRRYGPLPPTAEVKTGSGRHLYFRGLPDIKSTIGELGRRLDIRGDDGYVVAPPSIHANGRQYSWNNDAPILPAPHWLAGSVGARMPLFPGDRMGL